MNRYNSEVNGYFLCDRGRFGYEFVNSPRAHPRSRWRGERWCLLDAALEALRSAGRRQGLSASARRAHRSKPISLCGTLVGAERFFAGHGRRQSSAWRAIMLGILRAGPARTPSLREIEEADAVLVLGEDLTNTAPRYRAVAAAVGAAGGFPHCEPSCTFRCGSTRACARRRRTTRSPLFVATPAATRLDDIAARTFRGAPDEIARLGFAVAGALDPAAPPVPDLGQDTAFLAGFIAEALRTAQKPVVISGAEPAQ